jgi:hypothetical protein
MSGHAVETTKALLAAPGRVLLGRITEVSSQGDPPDQTVSWLVAVAIGRKGR